MKYTQGQYIIAEKTAIAREIYSFTIVCPEVASAAAAGQFVHIRAKGFTLRRPISICGIDKEKGTIRIVFEIRGEGTSEIARLNKLGVKLSYLIFAAAALAALIIAASELLLTVFFIRLLFARKKKAEFSRIGKSPYNRFRRRQRP